MDRGLRILGIALLVSILCGPAPVCADNQHGEGAKTDHKEADAHHNNDNEQKHDLFAKATDLAIWTLLVFFILLFVLSKFAWKPMMQGLEHRERAIHSALHEAQQAREEAARLRTQLEERMRQANEKARQMIEEARRAAERTAAELTAEAHKKNQAEYERMQQEMSLAYDRAKRELQTQVVQLSTLVASKIIRHQINPDDHRRFMDEALAELHRAGNGRQQTVLV